MTLHLPILTAPDHLKGRMSKWTPQALRDERMAWMLARAKEGHTGPQIAASLGIAATNVNTYLRSQGYQWWDQPRDIRRGVRAAEARAAA